MADDHAPADGDRERDARGRSRDDGTGASGGDATSDERRENDGADDRESSGNASVESEAADDASTEETPGEDAASDEESAEAESTGAESADATTENAAEAADVPPADVRKYERFKKMDGAQYDRVNEFLRERTYITAREWAIARLCADFRTETGVEMTKIGENLPELVPFMTDTYTPQAVNQARSAFENKVRMAGATFLYGAMSGFFTAEELDEMMYEVTEVAKFLLEVEGVDLAVAEELDAEERISSVMREVREASADLREEELNADD